jgi:drug/metabolite transporter (DMT)-like permease
MFGGATDAGQMLGNLLAFGVSICFAAQVTMLRKFHATVDMLPQVMIAGLWTLLPAFLLAGTFAATPRDIAVLAFMGCVQLGMGCLLATAASRDLRATEIGLLALIEPITGPLWVWLLMGEDPGGNALLGGTIVLAAVVANEVFAAWRGRDPVLHDAAPGP